MDCKEGWAVPSWSWLTNLHVNYVTCCLFTPTLLLILTMVSWFVGGWFYFACRYS